MGTCLIRGKMVLTWEKRIKCKDAEETVQEASEMVKLELDDLQRKGLIIAQDNNIDYVEDLDGELWGQGYENRIKVFDG